MKRLFVIVPILALAILFMAPVVARAASGEEFAALKEYFKLLINLAEYGLEAFRMFLEAVA